jgi:hypothetical protein
MERIGISVVMVVIHCFCIFVVAEPIRELEGLESISFFEKTGGLHIHTIDVNNQILLTRLPFLNSSSYDFKGTQTEYYDVFYSDVDGDPNQHGEYVTIETSFQYALPYGGGLNISEIGLNFSDENTELANHVSHFRVLGDNGQRLSVPYSVDGDMATYTEMGNNIGESIPLSLTVTFPSIMTFPVCPYKIKADLNDDCKVDLMDFSILAEVWLVDCYFEPWHYACISK